MKAILKRATALLLAGVMLLAFAACNPKDEVPSGDVSAEGGIIPSDVNLEVVVTSHPSWPYSESWAVWKYIKEAMGPNLSVRSIPAVDFATKFTLMLATPKELPNVLALEGVWDNKTKLPALDGAYVSLTSNLDKMPNFEKFLNDMSEEDREKFLAPRKWIAGEVYFTPIANMELQKNVYGWLYRKDIFEKHGLETPETIDELFDVCVKLKELYPDSYPLSMRNGISQFNTIGPMWAPYFQTELYYNFDDGKWHYGATEPAMKEIMEFLIKARDAKIIPENYPDFTTNEWQEVVTTNRGFIFPDYQTRMDFFNTLGREIDPNFTLSACIPPRAENGTGENVIASTNIDQSGMLIMNTGDQKEIDASLKYVDWFYSPEGIELVSWGKEGETYEVVDGKKKFILPAETDTPLVKYGFQTIGSYTVVEVDAVAALASEEQFATTEMILEHQEPNKSPTFALAFTSEQDAIITSIEPEIRSYTRENLSKFFYGHRPMSEWDDFVTGFEEFDLQGLFDVYTEAYNASK